MLQKKRPDNFFRYARIEVVDKPDPTGEGMTEQIYSKVNRLKMGIKIPYQISPTGFSVNSVFWKKYSHIISAAVNHTVDINNIVWS